MALGDPDVAAFRGAAEVLRVVPFGDVAVPVDRADVVDHAVAYVAAEVLVVLRGLACDAEEVDLVVLRVLVVVAGRSCAVDHVEVGVARAGLVAGDHVEEVGTDCAAKGKVQGFAKGAPSGLVPAAEALGCSLAKDSP